jgi:hypothetical protein
MGGTGITANGSMGGTGVTLSGSLGGTGVTNDKGMGGTGATGNGSMGGTGVDNGFGGTGVTADGGMGGTGISAENGFGGPGLLPNDTQGGVAIIGVVTGFASICVNGEEVFYDKNTPVYDNGVATKLSSLATGKMVMLKADKVGGQLRARAIGLFDAVAGPVGRVDAKLNQMQVMGQTVHLNQNMMQQVKGLSPNANVRVSGHRLDSGEIVATRLDTSVSARVDVNPAGNASTIGLVTSVASNGVFVNGTRVNFANKNDFDKIKVGSEVRVNGVWDGSAMQANRVESQPIKNSINRADTAIIEGFVKTGRENTMRLGGTEIEASQGSTSYSSFEKSRGKVVKVEMRRDSKGRWVCDKLEERSGKLFERHGSIDSDSNSGGELSGGGSDNGDRSSGDNSGSGSNSGSGRDSSGSGSNSGSGSSSSSGHGSSSGSGSGHGASSSGGSGRSSGSSTTSGGSGRGPSGGSSGSGGSSRGGSGSGSGSGKGK